MPVGFGRGRNSPSKVPPREPTQDMVIGRHIRGIVIVDECALKSWKVSDQSRCKEKSGQQSGRSQRRGRAGGRLIAAGFRLANHTGWGHTVESASDFPCSCIKRNESTQTVRKGNQS